MSEGGSPPFGIERRRAPRFVVDTGETAVLHATSSVRILDLSLSGVLVESAEPAKAGARGRLRLDMNGLPFSADIEIRRVSGLPGTNRFRIGAAFVSLSSEHERMIARFTER